MPLRSQATAASRQICSLPDFPQRVGLVGKHVAMVTFSPYPSDPRPRRAADALLTEGMSVDMLCLADGTAPRRETSGQIDIVRIPITHRRGGKVSYAYQYSAFILASAGILALRSIRRRYDLVYIHNMPDILVLASLIPKALGARVVLDMHDPMPELMRTIFNLSGDTRTVRLMKRLEKWCMARADLVVTVNVACKRIFASRSCPADKIGVVMNSPDEQIFPLRTPRLRPAEIAASRRFVIMYHGSIVERNGLDLAVEALGRIRETVPTAELRIYGKQTPFLEEVLDKARHAGLQDRVRYLGPRRLEELVPEIEDCDLGVIPNPRNAFTDINTPTRIFEYLAMAKPVIAPRTPGIQAYFPEDSLLCFESGMVDDLARQIEYVFFHPEESLKIVERGQKVFSEHSWAQEKETLVTLVSGVLA